MSFQECGVPDVSVKIVHLTPTLLPEAGGLYLAVQEIAQGQAAMGHQVTVVCPLEIPSTLSQANGVTYMSLALLGKGWGLGTGWVAQLEDLQPEVLHLHGLWEPFLHQAARWATRKHIPYGLTPHGMEEGWHRNRRRFMKRVFRRVCRYEETWRKARWIQVLNEEELADWSARTHGCTRLIPNGATHMVPLGEPPAWLRAYDGKMLVTFMGRLHAQKDPEAVLDGFLEVANTHPEAVLVLAGPDGGLLTGLQQRVRERGFEHQVLFPGFVEGNEKAHLWQRTDVCVHLSRSEGHSLTLLEAAAYGVPVLMSSGARFPELAEVGGARIATPGKVFQQALEHLLDDPSERERMGERGRSLITTRYSWTTSVEALLDLYRSS